MTDPVPLTAEAEASMRRVMEGDAGYRDALYTQHEQNLIGAFLATLDRDRSTPSVDGLDLDRLTVAIVGVVDATTRARVLPYAGRIAAKYAALAATPIPVAEHEPHACCRSHYLARGNTPVAPAAAESVPGAVPGVPQREPAGRANRGQGAVTDSLAATPTPAPAPADLRLPTIDELRHALQMALPGYRWSDIHLERVLADLRRAGRAATPTPAPEP